MVDIKKKKKKNGMTEEDGRRVSWIQGGSSTRKIVSTKQFGSVYDQKKKPQN